MADPQGPQEARIGVFLRLRPVARPTDRITASPEEGWLEFSVPRDAKDGLINNSRELYRFPFDGLLQPAADQAEVFDRVAAPVLRAALDGYNGTVFAFGQTGSGKTFTITGGPEHYADRGLIPRAVSALFAEAAARGGYTYTLHVSYMEIYNEAGYDLLEPGRQVAALEDLPRVAIQEDDEGRMHTRNLSLHRCDTEEQALNMLFLGDTNRVVAETPLNQASSRSHCVFTLHLEARRAGEPVVRRSKLHFVDLAGSERVGKTGLAAHAQLREAKYINLSLHYLEQVIVCLQEGRGHVPYRNSVLTQVLRDSLGGNTRTVMVAAVAPEAQHLEESIATCRFAQRVACISNRVEVNEELDLEALIKRLRHENALLRQEVQLLRSGGGGGGAEGGAAAAAAGDGADGSAAAAEGGCGEAQALALSEVEQGQLRRQVQAYVADPAPDAVLGVQGSMRWIHAAFGLLKGLARGVSGSSGGGGGSAGSPEAAAELRTLRVLVQQQEQQIGVLSGVLRKQAAAAGGGSVEPGSTIAPAPVPPAIRPPSSSAGSSTGSGVQHRTAGTTLLQPAMAQQQQQQQQVAALPPYSDHLLADQRKAFEYFCATSPAHDAVAEHKAALRGRYEAARGLGAEVAAAKRRVGELKSGMEQRRLARSMAALLAAQQGGGGGEGQEAEVQQAEAEEARAKAAIEQEKAAYRDAYDRLKAVKGEIDGLQAALERGRARLQADFQAWFTAMAAGAPGAAAGGSSGAGEGGVATQQAAPMGASKAKAQVPPQQPADPDGWLIPAAGSQSGGSVAPAPTAASLPAPAAASAATMAAALPSFASWEAAPSFRFGPAGGSPAGTPPAGTPRQGSAVAAQQQRQQQQQQLAAPQASWQGSQAAAAAPEEADPLAGVDPEVLEAARPLLTGNPAADADIIRFYQARAALLAGMRS